MVNYGIYSFFYIFLTSLLIILWDVTIIIFLLNFKLFRNEKYRYVLFTGLLLNAVPAIYFSIKFIIAFYYLAIGTYPIRDNIVSSIFITNSKDILVIDSDKGFICSGIAKKFSQAKITCLNPQEITHVNSFDLVFFDLNENCEIDNINKNLNEIYRILKKDGTFVGKAFHHTLYERKKGKLRRISKCYLEILKSFKFTNLKQNIISGTVFEPTALLIMGKKPA